MIAKNVPGGIRRLRRIRGCFAGNALAPSGHAIDIYFHEQDAPLLRAHRTDLEWRDQLHDQLSQRDLSYAHRLDGFSCEAHSSKTRSTAPKDMRTMPPLCARKSPHISD